MFSLYTYIEKQSNQSVHIVLEETGETELGLQKSPPLRRWSQPCVY